MKINTPDSTAAAKRIRNSTKAGSVVLAASPTVPKDVGEALADAADVDVSTKAGVQELLGNLVRAHILGLKKGKNVLPDVVFKESLVSLVELTKNEGPDADTTDAALKAWTAGKT